MNWLARNIMGKLSRHMFFKQVNDALIHEDIHANIRSAGGHHFLGQNGNGYLIERIQGPV